MNTTIFSLRNLCAVVLLTAVLVGSMFAQAPPDKGQPGKGANDIVLTSQLVKTGLYLISSGRNNTLMRFTPGGLILVDGMPAENYRPLMSQVRKISKMSDLPVGVVIVTDHHEDHTGTNAKFLAANVQIVAQENAKANMTDARPTFTYAQNFAIKVGGVEARLEHFGNAHTNGDTVVYFPNLKVVAVGDLFTTGTPEPDFSKGGSLVGWGPVLAEVLKLDFDVAVPSAGAMITRADLQAFKTKLDTLVSRATDLVKAGTPKEQLMARLKTEDLGWQVRFTGEQLDRFYAELGGK